MKRRKRIKKKTKERRLKITKKSKFCRKIWKMLVLLLIKVRRLL